MPIIVEASGRVTDAPSRVSTDQGMLAVFVFDPYPEPAPAGAVHGCEVRCRDEVLIGEVLRHGVVGASVAVSGELTLSATAGPVEDELSAVRVGIEADDVWFGSGSEPNCLSVVHDDGVRGMGNARFYRFPLGSLPLLPSMSRVPLFLAGLLPTTNGCSTSLPRALSPLPFLRHACYEVR